MSQHESGYERKALDQHDTPSWVTLALVPHLPEIKGVVWEPDVRLWEAAGLGLVDHRTIADPRLQAAQGQRCDADLR
jgi:hypothetical protein